MQRPSSQPQVTGAGDHIPWYSRSMLNHAYNNKAIVIAPDYPLGPEANYTDISKAMSDFLRFYRMDGCFEDGVDNWTEWLTKETDKSFTIDRNNLFIEGESAGGHAAVTALFHNARSKKEFRLPIKAVFLRYPMIKHYKREEPANRVLDFMGHQYPMAVVNEKAQALKKEILKLEDMKVGDTDDNRRGYVRTRTKGYAPQYMWPAPLLSITGEWQWLFQREHGLGNVEGKAGEPKNLDAVEKVERLAVTVDHESFPPIVIHHGVDDPNCPFENTKAFKEALHKHFPTRYPKRKDEKDEVTDERVYLIPVTELMEKDGIEKNHSGKVGHGYDYWQLKEPFILQSYDHVKRFWPKE